MLSAGKQILKPNADEDQFDTFQAGINGVSARIHGHLEHILRQEIGNEREICMHCCTDRAVLQCFE